MKKKLPVASCQLPEEGSSRSTVRAPLLHKQLATNNKQPAFTLVELIISIGLVLIIMLGVNFVFKMTGDTINAGQSLNDNLRNTRAGQSVLREDFARYVPAPDAPCLLLKSRSLLAFRNKADQDGDPDYNEGLGPAALADSKITIADLDNDGTFISPGESARVAIPGERSHRADVFSFFARGNFKRQTGGDVGGGGVGDEEDPLTPLIADMSSGEAWVWYGHLVLPNNSNSFYLNGNSGTKTNPGEGIASNNPNNFFASSWALGRFAGLLVEPYDDNDSSTGTTDVILDRPTGGKRQVFIGRDPSLPANSTSCQPLTEQSSARYERVDSSTVNDGTGVVIELRDSRFDLVGTSMSAYRSTLNTAITNAALAGSTDFRWWNPMMLNVRFETSPFVTKPIRAPGYAAQAPFFMNSCTQFIVEYAGDFLTQNNDPNDPNFGQVTGAFIDGTGTAVETDGQIDFVVLGDTNGDGLIQPNERATARKAIRWYGFPRDTDGDGIVIGGAVATPRANRMRDTVPLRDLLSLLPGPPRALFERFSPIQTDNDYLLMRASYVPPTAVHDDLDFEEEYTCAWGPTDNVRPKMIRIVMVVDDPTGRLAEPQTYEYVFSLPSAD